MVKLVIALAGVMVLVWVLNLATLLLVVPDLPEDHLVMSPPGSIYNRDGTHHMYSPRCSLSVNTDFLVGPTTLEHGCRAFQYGDEHGGAWALTFCGPE